MADDLATLAAHQEPNKHRNGSTFNSATAKIASAIAAKNRSERAGKPSSTIPPMPPQPAAISQADDAEESAGLSAQERQELSVVSEQITLTLSVLNDKDYRYCSHCKRSGVEPHHRAQLIRALDSLLDRRRILRGQPMPGSLRPEGKAKSNMFTRPGPAPSAPVQSAKFEQE